MIEQLSRNQVAKVLLSISYVVLSVGVVVAYLSPASGYELSIYTATPVLYWATVCAALSFSVGTTLILQVHRKISLFLAGLAVFSVAALPLVRGYYFVSEGDALSHLGLIRDIEGGLTSPWEMFYPLSHLLSLTSSWISGMATEQSMLVVNMIFILIFIVSVPITVRRLSPESHAVSISVYCALMLPLLTQNGVHFTPNGFGRMYLAFTIALLAFSMISDDRRFPLLFTVSIVALLFLHGQIATVLVVSLLGISVMYFVLTRLSKGDFFSPTVHSPHIIALIASIATYTWIYSKERFASAFEGFFVGILFRSQVGGDTIDTTTSLAAVGGSVPEVVIKLFSAQLALTIAATVHILVSTREYGGKILNGTSTSMSAANSFTLALVGALVPLVGLVLMTFVAGSHYTRYFMTSMTIVVIIATLGIPNIPTKNWKQGQNIVSVAILFLLLSTVFVMYPSPYIYQANTHVPEAQVNGFETTFDYSNYEEIDIVRVRSPVFRYLHAVKGVEAVDYFEYTGAYRAGTPDHFANHNLPSYFNESKYLTVTEADRQRDPIAYAGLRYSNEDFEYLERDTQIKKVLSNNQFDLYLVGNERA